MLYYISYRIFESGAQEKFMKAIDELGESLTIFPNSKVLDSDSDVNKIFEKLYATIDPIDQIMILPFKLDKIQGFISNPAIKWLKERVKA